MDFLDALDRKKEKVGRLGNTFFIYDSVAADRSPLYAVVADRYPPYKFNYVNYKVLENIIRFIPFWVGKDLEIDKEANFGGSVLYSIYLPDKQFKEWYDLEMKIRFEGNEICGACEKIISSHTELSLWGGVRYHRKGCFAKTQNKEWKYFNYPIEQEYIKYVLKIVENFDPDNPALTQLRIKFSLREISKRIRSAYENYLPFCLYGYEGMSKKEARAVIKEELNTAKKYFRDIQKAFLHFNVAEKLLAEGPFLSKIKKIFEDGREWGGIAIGELEPYNQIMRQLETLFNLYIEAEKI